MLDIQELITERAHGIDASGIRKIFELAASVKDPVNLSIGQPDFDVPPAIKQAAIDAIMAGRNGYTVTQGIADLHAKIGQRLKSEIGWDLENDDLDCLVTSGTSGGLILAYLALAERDDEVIVPDPYFVIYPHAATLVEARPVLCDTYPDFKMTAARIEPLITPRTKFVLLNSPGNPSGVVIDPEELERIVQLCDEHNVLLISDEIYDEFTYRDGRDSQGRFPTPARFTKQMLLLRGFSKTYAMTGWRLGYAVGPKALIQQMAKLQQYTFVCAPSMVQHAGIAALETDVSDHVAAYAKKRDMVVEALAPLTNLTVPRGAFYAFVEVPEHMGITATEFVARAIAQKVLIIPGNVFSARDTHFRISYATTDEQLARGLALLSEMMTPE